MYSVSQSVFQSRSVFQSLCEVGWKSAKIAEKLLDYANTTNDEFIVDEKVLFYGWLIYGYLHQSWSS